LRELEFKSNHAEEDLSELKSDLEAVRMNLILSNGRVKKNIESIKELTEIVNGLKGLPVEVPSQTIQSASSSNIDVSQDISASKDALANLEKRLLACEKTNVTQNGTLGSHEDRISALENNFDSFASDTNSKVQALQDLIGNIGSGPVPSSGGPSVDSTQLQLAIAKLQSELKSKAS
jgi:chromosome segregation ATPase